METLTTLPGVQLYSANGLSLNCPGKEGAEYHGRDAVCLETQDLPRPPPTTSEFPGHHRDPQASYSATTLYRFDTAPL